MKETFIEKKFVASSLEIIQQANDILDEYKAGGYVVTLRTLYYQFVARGLLPNKQTEYKRLGGIISDARLAGLVDWAALEDATRTVERVATWDTPASIIEAVADQYKEDWWQMQDVQPEVWVEKEALLGIIAPACRRFRVPYFACRGYASQSAQYEASKRFLGYIGEGRTPIVLHLGDHDPSGIDMTRENREKIELLTGREIEVRRLALNMPQIEEHNPPPNPAKATDARFAGYQQKYGNESWELDALPPPVIDRLIVDAIEPMIDADNWSRAQDQEDANRSTLQRVSDRWDDVAEFVS